MQLFLERIPQEVADSFTQVQLAAIGLHFGMRYRVSHAIDWRGRFLKFYFVLLAGRERRQAR